jgi:hypothetical protein
MVRYEEKDLFMSRENQKELMERLNTNEIVLPQVFADGACLGVNAIHITAVFLYSRAGRKTK